MLKILFQRMTADISPLVIEMHQTRTQLYDLLDAEKERAAKIPPQHRDADQVLKQIREKLTGARTAFAQAEAALEKAKADHASCIAMANLLAAYVQAGKDTAAVEAAIAQALGVQAPAQTQPTQPPVQPPVQTQPAQQNSGLESDVFTVLEVRPGKTAGTIRAYCQAADGTKHAIYAKNGHGQALAASVGKQVQVKYRQGDKGLIAVQVAG